MGSIREVAGAIGGLVFGGVLLLLLSPTLDPVTAVNLEGWGQGLFILGVVLAIITAGAAVWNLLENQ